MGDGEPGEVGEEERKQERYTNEKRLKKEMKNGRKGNFRKYSEEEGLEGREEWGRTGKKER